MTAVPCEPTLSVVSTLTCNAASGELLLFQGHTHPLAERLALALAFGVRLARPGTYAVKLIDGDQVARIADALDSCFAFPLRLTAGTLKLGRDLDHSVGHWSLAEGCYIAALYEVFEDCTRALGAHWVLALVAQNTLPPQRWQTIPHISDQRRTPEGLSIPRILALPGDDAHDTAMPNPRELLGDEAPSEVDRPLASNAPQSKTIDSNSVTSRLMAAISALEDDEFDSELDDFQDDDTREEAAPGEAVQADPFVALIQGLVEQEQLALVESASVRKLAGRLELALERDPMMFQRPGDWFFDQDDVDELFASDSELQAAISRALS